MFDTHLNQMRGLTSIEMSTGIPSATSFFHEAK